VHEEHTTRRHHRLGKLHVGRSVLRRGHVAVFGREARPGLWLVVRLVVVVVVLSLLVFSLLVLSLVLVLVLVLILTLLLTLFLALFIRLRILRVLRIVIA